MLCLLLCENLVNLAGSSRDHGFFDRQGEEDYLQKAKLPVRPSWVPAQQASRVDEAPEDPTGRG